MTLLLTPAKVVLLAVNFASVADVGSLRSLATEHKTILGSQLLLRILLTYLPETTPPSAYVDLVQDIGQNLVPSIGDVEHVDTSSIDSLSEEQAARRVRKLRLLELTGPDSPNSESGDDNLVPNFLYKRARQLDEGLGMISHLEDLLMPFTTLYPSIQVWLATTVLPLIRRNIEYYSFEDPTTISGVEKLPPRTSVRYLLSSTGYPHGSHELVDRDFRDILLPWLYNKSRWNSGCDAGNWTEPQRESPSMECAGWDEALGWLVLQASKSWRVAVRVSDQWGGPKDANLPANVKASLGEPQMHHLKQSYAKASIACAYSISEPSLDAIKGAYLIMHKVALLLGAEQPPAIENAVEDLAGVCIPDSSSQADTAISSSSLRGDLLRNSPLAEPTDHALQFLRGVLLSAFILTKLGLPCTVRRAAEKTLLDDSIEQRGDLIKLIRLASSHAQKNNDVYWTRIRSELLWLQNWDTGSKVSQSAGQGRGPLGTVPKQEIEIDILKAMLSQSRFDLARSLYQDSGDAPLPEQAVQEAVYQAALDTFDNASNPNRTKGGLRKCNDIINTFPKMVPKSLPAIKQIESLLSAAHSLSGYKLVLKQGEPFSPVVLRVHSDPISIIDRVLEQNRGAYTRLQEFLEIGMNMVTAGFLSRNRPRKSMKSFSDQDATMAEAEKRIVSSCISAALGEDDFETAYSYVVSRLGGPEQSTDDWSWTAALKAGEYVRTSKTQQPTHLGTSSGNLEVRHLEQRLECLATALRVAPASQLQTVLESFRDCEEHLNAAINDEAAREVAWDTAGELREVPGSFETSSLNDPYPPRNLTASRAARQVEETPMSLFDLSRATARIAQRNFTSLSSLNGLSNDETPSQASDPPVAAGDQRVRRRDQLREAATGTLVSGVGWLIGANMNREEHKGN